MVEIGGEIRAKGKKKILKANLGKSQLKNQLNR